MVGEVGFDGSFLASGTLVLSSDPATKWCCQSFKRITTSAIAHAETGRLEAAHLHHFQNKIRNPSISGTKIVILTKKKTVL
jgi:hypothetical protein